jgi:hypothetical protein
LHFVFAFHLFGFLVIELILMDFLLEWFGGKLFKFIVSHRLKC